MHEVTPSTTSTVQFLKEEEEFYVVPVGTKNPVVEEAPSMEFFSKPLFRRGDKELANSRKAYLKVLLPGVFLVALTILAIFSIFWGASWAIPAHTLQGWIVDFDGGDVGHYVVDNLRDVPNSPISWSVVPSSQFSQGLADLTAAVENNGAWVAVVINEGATGRLQGSVLNPNGTYSGEEAMTIFAVEARNENAYRNIIKPGVEASAHAIALAFRSQHATNLSTSSNMASILATSPQTVVNPVSFTIVNLVPFAQPVASAALSTGLIFVLIMSYFVVLFAASARDASGLNRQLQFKSLIALRLGTLSVAYFFLSLMFTFVNLGFKLDLGHRYGHAGFMLFWIVSWIYMLAVGLAIESLITILRHFVPFFLILWIVVNVSANLYPLEVLPKFFHYGYATPFYNVSKAIRTIVFGTRNTLGLNIGVLLAWVLVSCVTMIFFQWNVRRQAINAMSAPQKPLTSVVEEKMEV